MKKIIIIGAGGNSKVIIDVIQTKIQMGEAMKVIGVLDDDDSKTQLKDYPVLGSIKLISNYRNDKEVFFINGIGNNDTRRMVFESYSDAQYYTLIHPSVLIGSGVTIGLGSVIMPGVIINSDSFIGKQSLINTGAIIEHDNIIGDFVHVASGAVTAGNVKIGELSMLGTGVKVIQGIRIGKNAMIGAGATVISDIPPDCTAVGVPAKVLKYNKHEDIR